MSSINTTTLKTWNDRDVMTAAQYDAERNLIITAVNDNATQLTNLPNTYYNKTTVDQKFQNVATTATIASGTAFPGSAIAGQLFYRTDLKAMYEYDTTNGWQLNVKAGTGIVIGTDGTISVTTGTTTSPGALQVGTGLGVSGGVIDAKDLLWQIHMGIGGF